jgi:hypothetical protein
MFDTFDMPDPHESCARRTVTTSPLQALTLLNSQLTLEWAQGFAGRVLRAAGSDPSRQIQHAFELALGRSPDPTEARLAREFFQEHQRLLEDRVRYGEPLALPTRPAEVADAPNVPTLEPAQGATLVDFCHTLLNANEFVYRH